MSWEQKVLKGALIGALVHHLTGCASGVPLTILTEELHQPEQAEAHSECSLSFAPSDDIYDATVLAADRWSRATGCAFWIAEGGVPVALVPEILTPDGRKALGVTKLIACEPSYINVAVYAKSVSAVVTHEMGHVLSGACDNDSAHTESGVMRHSLQDDIIDEASLSIVCATLPCTAFRIEG